MKNLNSFCFLAIDEGMRESTQNWREVFLKLKSRGMNEPELVIGDFTIGFLAALKTSIPRQGQQSSWMHKTMNVFNCLPKSAEAKAKDSLHDI
jgi:putative transposase